METQSRLITWTPGYQLDEDRCSPETQLLALESNRSYISPCAFSPVPPDRNRVLPFTPALLAQACVGPVFQLDIGISNLRPDDHGAMNAAPHKIVNLLTAQGFGGWKDGPVGKVPATSRKTQVPIPSTHWKPNMGALVCNPVSGAGSQGHALMKGFTEFP